MYMAGWWGWWTQEHGTQYNAQNNIFIGWNSAHAYDGAIQSPPSLSKKSLLRVAKGEIPDFLPPYVNWHVGVNLPVEWWKI